MPNLYKITTSSEASHQKFTNGEIVSILYHDIFDFPLTVPEMIRWRVKEGLKSVSEPPNIISRDGFYFLEGKEGIIYKRTLRKRISERKMSSAKRASKIFSFMPFIKMIAVTGSLSMENSSEDSDIDLMIITQKGRLWTTRLMTYLLASLFGLSVRKPEEKDEKDKLCLNMWLDESDLAWRKNRNIYTAHEIAQAVPLLNKDNTYEKFLTENKWILNYWPYSIRTSSKKHVESSMQKPKTLLRAIYYLLLSFIENLTYRAQKMYMNKKITRELVTPTRALFHPHDWSKIVATRV